MTGHSVGSRVRFGPFTLDLRSGELHKGSTRLKVPDQSIEILKALLERPGDLVTREELQQRLWPSDTVVDQDSSTSISSSRMAASIDGSPPIELPTMSPRSRGMASGSTLHPCGAATWKSGRFRETVATKTPFR